MLQAVSQGGSGVGEAFSGGRRETILEQKILGEDLAALQLGSGLIGTEDGQSGLFKFIDHACAKRRFRADNRQVRFFGLGPDEQTVDIADVEGKIRAQERSSGVAGRGIELERGIVLLETPGDGVLATAGPDKKDLHGDFSR